MYTVYGIPNCDSVKKARKHLEEKGIEFTFYDFKKSAPLKKDIMNWKSYLGELPVNKRGTTFRKLKEDYEAGSEKEKVEILVNNSSAIKRPIVQKGDKVIAIGWPEVATL